MNKLTKLANKYRTDKGTEAYEAHGYTEEYIKYIPDTGRYKLLEIGIYHGSSLKMWSEYNLDMDISGVDIDFNVLNYIKPFDNVDIFIGDATSKEFISGLVSEVGSFDFIIDDGSHKHEDILASFKLLFPHLKDGGFYFIEDLHVHSRPIDIFMDIHSWLISEGILLKSELLEFNGKLWIIQK